MLTLDLPEIELHEVALEPDSRRALRGEPEEDTTLRSRVELGQIVSVPLKADMAGDDPVLRHFLEAETADYKFHLVRLSCGFKPADGEKFSRAWLKVPLRREDGVMEPGPIAWSMAPLRQVKSVKVSTTAKIGSKLEILESGIEAGEEYERDEIFLEANKPQSSDPYWEFQKTDKVEIRGTFLLSLVVRSPTTSVIRGGVLLSVTVQHTRLLFLPVKSALGHLPDLSFRLL
jgi:hypothetical protein